MGNTIRIKRRISGSGAPTVGSGFANAELAFNEVDNILYYGKGETGGNGIATSIIAIAGDGTFATKTYVDGAVAASAPSGVAYLAASNTFDAAYTNTFNGTVNLEGAFQIDAQAVTTTAAELNFLDGVTSVTGSGALVLDTSPTLVTPNLGTPTSGTLTNCTDLPVSGLSGLGSDVATFLATASSANLASAVTDETGSGALVFATSPTLVTPALGTPTSGTLTSCTDLPVSTGLSGLGSDVATFLATASSANLASAVTDETGSGALVFATSPTLVTPALGTPTSGTLTSCTDLPVSTGLSGLGTNVATFLATPSSANLASAVSDETGSGSLVFATSPTITTSIVAGSASMNIFNAVATTVNAFGVATALSMGASTGTTTINNDLTVLGNLTISGTTTTINSAAISVDDINIILGDTASPTNATANGGGITLKGATDKTITWVSATAAWTSSEDFNLVIGKVYKVNGAQIAAYDLSNGTTGSGSIVLATSPTLVTPALGTPTSGVLTSCTGLPISGISNLGSNVATFLATPTSSNLNLAVTDETGSGLLVFNTSPTLTTPTLGVASATSINKVAITAPATSATITVANGKTFTCNNTMTFTNTNDVSPVEFGTGGTVVYLSAANAFIGANTFTHATGQTFRSAVTQDAIILQGRAGGNSSYAATFTTATLTANRTITFPNETGTVVTTASVCAAIAECTIDGGNF